MGNMGCSKWVERVLRSGKQDGQKEGREQRN